MTNNFRYFFSISAIVVQLLALTSCSPESFKPSQKNLGTDYAPIAKGNYWIYKVREIRHDFAKAKSDTITYYLKEVVKDTFPSIEGDIYWKVLVQTKTLPENEWQNDSIYRVSINSSRLLKYEGNLPYIKLQFPIEEGKSWNGNLFNYIGGQEGNYKLTGLGKPISILDSIYPATLRVSHYEDSSRIGKKLKYEIYAKQVGLIFKEFTFLDYDEEIFNEKKIVYGFEKRLFLDKYGKE